MDFMDLYGPVWTRDLDVDSYDDIWTTFDDYELLVMIINCLWLCLVDGGTL
jgi:hypothetical protein